MTNKTHFTNDQVTDEARRWALKSDDLTPVERKQLERWLRASPEHPAEYEAAQDLWRAMDFLQLAPDDPAREIDLWVTTTAVQHNRARKFGWAVVGVLAVVALAASWQVVSRDYSPEYRTAIGEQRTIHLPDESIVLLNTDTQLTVEFDDGVRNIHLDRGEAYFKVAHDANRPFVVAFEHGILRALGTEFNVLVDEEAVEVIVTDGEVEISQRSANPTAFEPATERSEAQAGPAEKLSKGDTATISGTIESVVAIDSAELERKLGWQDGTLEFVNMPLREVVDEVGRYTGMTLIITDSELDAYPVTIVARTNNVGGMLRNLDISTDAFAVRFTADNRVLISTD